MTLTVSSGVPTAFSNVAATRFKYGALTGRYLSFLYQMDPLADAAAAALASLPAGRGRSLLNESLESGIDAIPNPPEALRELFRQVDEVPLWVDWEEMDRGGAAMMRCALAVVVMACYSLPMAYSSPAGNKPLTFSGRLVHRAAPRLRETGRFFLATCQPGGLRRFSEGFKNTIKVRLMHAQVRRLLLQSGKWDQESWGAPISQCHLAGTNLLMSIAVLDGLRALGYFFTRREIQAALKLWRYSGYLSGVERELLCSTEEDAHRLLDFVFTTEGPPDEDATALVHALMEAAVSCVPWLRIDLCYGIARALLGRTMSDSLQLPNTPWKLMPLAARPFMALKELPLRAIPGAFTLAVDSGTRIFRSVLGQEGQGKGVDFAMPERISAEQRARGGARPGSSRCAREGNP